MNNIFKNSFVCLFLSLSFYFVQAQERAYCGTEHDNEEWLTYFAKHKEQIMSRNCDVYVPLTVHVLGDNNGVGYHPLSTIFQALGVLNSDFESSGITFFLNGPINYINNTAWYDHASFTTGNQMMNFNNVDNTINCYIVENAAGNCGYRTFGGDGIALAKSCTGINDHTWSHEVGHYLSLPHTFRGWEGTDYDGSEDTPTSVGSVSVELLDGSNCEFAGDGFCDTAPDYYSYRWGCDDQNENPDSLTDPNGAKFKVDGTYFMSYALDNCVNRFSQEQEASMCSYLETFIPDFISNATPLGDIDPSDTELVYPIGGQIVENNVTLEWEESGNATFYIVEVSRFPNMGILSARELVYGNTLDLFGLSDDKKYYWRVRTFNEYDFDYDKKTAVEQFETGELSSTQDYYSENLKIYPNPTQDRRLNLSLESQVSEDVEIKLTDLTGKTVFSKTYFFRNGSNEILIDTPDLAGGIYLLTGQGQNHSFQDKVIFR